MRRNFICGLSDVIITTFSQSVSACNVELCLQRPVWNRGVHWQQSNHQGRAAVQEVIVGICWISTFNFRRPAMIDSCSQWQHAIVAHTQPFNAPSFGTTQVAWYQKKHSPTHTHPDHQTSFINFLHLLWSTASSVFSLRACQSHHSAVSLVLLCTCLTKFFSVLFQRPVACVPTVLWHCWLGIRKSIRPGKNWVMRCWCGYLSGVRCRLFACGPADVTAIRNPIISCLIYIQTGFTFLVMAYPGCPGKEAVKRV